MLKNSNYNLFVLLVLSSVVSCKKDTLVEQVDVPATPIVAVERKDGKPSEVKANEGAFQLFELPYEYNGLEPNVDAMTLELHYSKHLLGYVNALNKVVVGTKYETLELQPLLKSVLLSESDIRNNAGAVFNHNFYFEEMAPKAGGQPEGELLESINRDFGTFDDFMRQFIETSVKYNGSGWTWLMSDKSGKLRIINTANNDCPLVKGLGVYGIPILNLDLWEHSYYLKFQAKKRDYVNTFFSTINWEVVQKRYEFPKVAFQAPKPTTETIEVPVENNTPQETNTP